MITVTKHELRSAFLTSSFPDHDKLKSEILRLLDDSPSEYIKSEANLDSITRLDWSSNEDFSRPWAHTFMHEVSPVLDRMVRVLGFNGVKILQLWYQQYKQADTHGWHSHSYNFTGVYYLELPDDAPRTQIVDPQTQGFIITPDVSEGDILLFPSYTIHRAPKVVSDTRKTIISFNFDLKHFSMDCLASLAVAEMKLNGIKFDGYSR
jgi:hypothetical protein